MPSTRTSGWTIGTVVSALLVVLVAIAGMGWYVVHSLTTSNDTTAQAGQTAGVQVPQVIVAGASCDIVTATMAAVESGGFNLDEYILDEADFDLSLPGANEVGEFAFAGEPVVTKAQMEEALASTSDERFNAMVLDTASKAKTPEETVRQSTDRWVNVQYIGETVAPANTEFRDGEVVDAGERQNKQGEVVWVYIPDAACEIVREAINEDGEIVFTQELKDAVAEAVVPVRGACLNPQGGMYQKPPPPPAQPGQPAQPGHPGQPPGQPEQPDKPKPPTPHPCEGVPPPGDGDYVPAPPPECWVKPGLARAQQQNDTSNPSRQSVENNELVESTGVDLGPTRDGNDNVVTVPPASRTGDTAAANPAPGGYVPPAGGTAPAGTTDGVAGDTGGEGEHDSTDIADTVENTTDEGNPFEE